MVVGEVAANVIYGVTGLPGSGKSYFAVRQLVRLRCSDRGRDRPVYTNMPLVLPYGPQPVLYESLSEIFDVHDCHVLLDEAQLVVGSRDWQSRDNRHAAFLSQLRKRRVVLWYTSQEITAVDKFLRDKTFLLYTMESFKRFGFFVYRSYFSSRMVGRSQPGLLFFSPAVGNCYDTFNLVEV